MKQPTEELSFLYPVREFPDKGTKWLLEFGENVKGLLQIVAKDLVAQLDFSRLRKVNQTFIPDNLREQESDVVYLVPFRSQEKGEVLIYVLIEHQSKVSPVMGFRVLFYMVQIWDAQRREWEDKKVSETEWRFRPIIPIVLHTGSRKWSVPIRMETLMDLPEELRRFVPAFDTLLLDVKGDDEQNLLRENHPFGWLLSVIRQEHASKEEFEQALRTAVEHLSELPPEEFPQWSRAIFYLTLLIFHRRSSKERDALSALVAESTQEKRLREEAEKMIQTAADELIQQGEKRGTLQTKRADVLELMQIRFDVVPEEVVKKVKSMRSMSRLDALFRQAAIANSISDMEID